RGRLPRRGGGPLVQPARDVIGSGTQTVDEPAGRRVQVEDADRIGVGVAESVDRSRRRGEEGAWPDDARLVADAELDLTFENVEGVDVVCVGVRVDALELRLEGHV